MGSYLFTAHIRNILHSAPTESFPPYSPHSFLLRTHLKISPRTRNLFYSPITCLLPSILFPRSIKSATECLPSLMYSCS
jgi:hypothetical protein